MEYLIYYICIGALFLLISSFVSGTQGKNIAKEDVIGACAWPISIMNLLGMLSTLIFYKFKITKGSKNERK